MGEAGLVLCGGRSRRMGADKAALPFGDETLLARVVRIVGTLCDELWLVARDGQRLPPVRHRGAEPDVARDPADGLGPLAGIAAGLRAMTAERAFVVSCDSPLLEPALIRRLLELSRGFVAAVPRVGGYLVPTTAVYSRALLPAAEALLARGELRPRTLVLEPGVRIVEEPELRAVDPELLSLCDCDTPDAYRALLARAGLAVPGPIASMLDGEPEAGRPPR
jgi:molybdopterin-guanine dinucleotide biosynthesis protein A